MPFTTSGSHLYLDHREPNAAESWVWMGVTDVELLLEGYQSQGAKIRHPPTNYSWAYEIHPDGNVLRFGSEPKNDQPLREWLDMNGQRWSRSNDGWKLVREG